MYTRCPSNAEVDRFDGHCYICNGDPDRCPTTTRDTYGQAWRDKLANMPPPDTIVEDTPHTHDGRILDHETGTLHYRDEKI